VFFELWAATGGDASTVAALDSISTKYHRRGTTVEIIGLNEASASIHERLTGQLANH
jgi:SulP family sulfate permease